MIVEIHGTGTRNQGAALMAVAISRHLRAVDPVGRIVVEPRFGTRDDRTRYRFRTLGGPRKAPARIVGSLLPRAMRRRLGLVQHSDIDAVLDASGFRFSDQWGYKPARYMGRGGFTGSARTPKLVLLPQAFGPFHNAAVAAECRRVLERADLLFARDRGSLDALQALGGGLNVHLCPDFTIPLEGAPATLPVSGSMGAIVPNVRMLDKTADQDGRSYLTFLQRATEAMKRHGLSPLIVLHDASDHRLLPRLLQRVGDVPTFWSADPLTLKGALGTARVVVGSRFHALVSALSQGVPCIGAGWSHKYRWLFHDFGCPDWILDDLGELDRLDHFVYRATAHGPRSTVVSVLLEHKAHLQAAVEQMWLEVDVCLGLGARSVDGLPSRQLFGSTVEAPR